TFIEPAGRNTATPEVRLNPDIRALHIAHPNREETSRGGEHSPGTRQKTDPESKNQKRKSSERKGLKEQKEAQQAQY
ncbi:hypothetical protein PS030_51985, partial [Shigella sonnei]|nr:hypothetical protein [Shigella sonnei]